jgi:hypothetical protein
MGCAQSLSRRLGSLTLFDVEVFDPATQKEVSFTDLQAAESKQRELEAAMLAGNSAHSTDLAAELHDLHAMREDTARDEETQT